MTGPVNLIETLTPDSSGVYTRRVLRRILLHAVHDDQLPDAEAERLWVQCGQTPESWLPSWGKLGIR
jgi:hypothetical protein